MAQERSALRVLQEALRSLEHRAVVRRSQRGQPRSRRAAAKVAIDKYHADGNLTGQRLSDWLATDHRARAPRDPDRVWAVVQVWASWAGVQADRQYWNELVEAAQPTPTRSLDASERAESGIGLGRPIGDCDAIDLEVHPAPPAALGAIGRSDKLPGYVRRSHDEHLAACVVAAAGGDSRIVTLVGPSSTGKTRACWEAIQPLADHGWRLWHPFDPDPAGTLLANVDRIEPRTVLWLNDAQHFFGSGNSGAERVAAALLSLLTDARRAPLLILVTLRNEYAERYLRSIHNPEGPHAQVRALIGKEIVYVPNHFDESAIAEAQALAKAGDAQLAASLQRAEEGRIAQDLAGCLELLDRYRLARTASRTLLEAAMDARRLGIGHRLPRGFLQQAAEGYFADAEFDAQDDDWFEQALADLARPVHGDLAPLRRIRSRRSTSLPDDVPFTSASGHDNSEPTYRLADYLEEFGYYDRGSCCPPSSFWKAAHDHVADSEEIAGLAMEALRRYRLSWAFHLQQRSGICPPSGDSAQAYAMRMRETAGDRAGADALVRREAESGSAWALLWLAARSEAADDPRSAEILLAAAAETGHVGAIARLLALREAAGDATESNLLRDRLAGILKCDVRQLPRMLLRKGPTLGLAHGDSLAPRAGYIWVEPHGPTAWVFGKGGEPIPTEYCATVDGIPLIVAFHSGDPDPFSVVEGLLAGATREHWLNLFISRQSISAYDADGYRQLEALADPDPTRGTTEAIARGCADAGAFRDSFYSDELDGNASREHNSWIIEHVTKWWPYGLDPDGTPSGPW